MSKKRMIDTRIWSDSWVRKLNALERYLFIYFLTNDKCTFCGIYELPLSIVAFETGIDENDLENAMLPKLEPKVFYRKGWVYLSNFRKYHVSDKSKNSITGYNTALSEIPKEIMDIFNNIEAPYKPLISPSDTFAFTSAFTSTSTFNNNAPPEGDIIKNLLNEETPIKYDYQYLGLEVFNRLDVPKAKKAECIRLAKLYPRLINPSLSFAIDYPRKDLRWKMFLWKLNDLKKNEK